jgi:glycosyltransferase involved in cell wall biosynthesis
MPTLSIIIPCYNEERTLGTLLELVHTVPLSIDKEIIVIDDASTDNTSRIIDVYASKIDTLIRQDTNQGKGAAISKYNKVLGHHHETQFFYPHYSSCRYTR